MDRASVINVKDFNLELFESKEPIEGKLANNKRVKHTSIPFTYNGKEALLKMSYSIH